MAVNATAVWRVRPSGSNTNGGGYDAGIAGAGTDYSQQNAAQLSVADGALTHGTTTLTSATGGFTSAMIGNALYLSGTNFTTGFYFITAFTNGNTVTIDRDPTASANGSSGTVNVGGGWADHTNLSTTGPMVAGNTAYILGSGIPNPAAYSYDYTFAQFTPPSGDASTGGQVRIVGDPATPNFSTGGRPVIQCPGLTFYNVTAVILRDLYCVASSALNGDLGIVAPANAPTLLVGITFDQFGYDIGLVSTGSVGAYANALINCEIFSSVAKRSTNARYAASLYYIGGLIDGCNIHDCIGPGVYARYPVVVTSSIIAKNGADGLTIENAAGALISNNTIDGNTGHGINCLGQGSLLNISVASTMIFNNIISNHSQAGKYGITVAAGTTAQNDRVKGFIDYNVFYNNTADTNAISYGAHDTHGGSNPYVGQGTENYSLA
jgi:hypothetical protein